jgi:hypothetical protein
MTTVDKWKWKSGSLGQFSVRSYYSILLESRPSERLDTNVQIAIRKLWRLDVPSKALIFGWRFLLDKLPTRSTLHYRGILLNPHDVPCIFCFINNEDRDHLFFSCSFS